MLLCAGPLLSAAPVYAQSRGASDWGFYGGDGFGRRFSSLDQINRGNVTRLQPVWTYRTGEHGAGLARAGKLTFEATPVLAYGALYLETGTNIVMALDPQTGRERWRFDPHIDRDRHYAEVTARGVSLWEDSDVPQHERPCRRRVFIGTLDARLLALDADTGRPCADFGTSGAIDLTQGVRIRDRDAYLVTSPPAVYGNLVIVGSAIGDNRAVSVERGVIRAFDARNGMLMWSFDPIPDGPDHPAALEWKPDQAQNTGAGNAWGVMTIDEEHGLVLIPTGSASPDFYGGLRLGSNRFADSLLVLERRHRQAGLASATRAPRSLGLRPGRPTGPRRRRDQRRAGTRGDPGDQDRHALRLRAHPRAASGRHHREARALEPRAWRAGGANAAILHLARARLAGAGTAAGCLGHHLLGPRASAANSSRRCATRAYSPRLTCTARC